MTRVGRMALLVLLLALLAGAARGARLRIAIAGDSLTTGFVDEGLTPFPARLQAQLDALFPGSTWTYRKSGWMDDNAQLAAHICASLVGKAGEHRARAAPVARLWAVAAENVMQGKCANKSWVRLHVPDAW